METIIYEFNGNKIEFQLDGEKDVKVNATQMAKVFGKHLPHFLENNSTKIFIDTCLKSRNSDFLGVKTETDLIISKQKSGTYMHRVLALKFAAWLNPDFEVWIYATIEKLIFGHFSKQKERLESKAKRLNRIAELEKQLQDNDNFKEYSELIGKNKKDNYLSRSENATQLNLLQQLFKK